MAAALAGLSFGAFGAEDETLPLPPVEQGVFERIRLAALGTVRLAAFGDPQDLTEPLLPDDVAPPGQPPQEFAPPGRKLPPGAKQCPAGRSLHAIAPACNPKSA